VYGGTFPLRVFGHELTHSIANPLPRVFGEAWATAVGLKVGEEQGGAEDARTEYKNLMRRMDRVDPKRNALDLMRSDEGLYSQDQYTKAVWLLMECQKRYGDGFMPRVLELRDKQYGIRKPVSLAQLFRLFAQASGDPKISVWFRSVGASVSSAP
jgi:hypothetical protein